MKSIISTFLAGACLLSLPACTSTSGTTGMSRTARNSFPSLPFSPANKVQRYCWVTGLNPQKAEYYKHLHAHPESAVNQMIKKCHIRNFSIYTRRIEGKEFLIAYLEYTGSDFAADMKKMAADPATIAWWKKTDPCQLPLPEAKAKGKIWSDAVQVYHLE